MTFIILHQADSVNVKIKKPQLPDGVPLQDSCSCILYPLFTLYLITFRLPFSAFARQPHHLFPVFRRCLPCCLLEHLGEIFRVLVAD